jgi:hypothetical protein
MRNERATSHVERANVSMVNRWSHRACQQPACRRSTGVSWRSPMVMGKLKQPSPDDLPMNDIHQR